MEPRATLKMGMSKCTKSSISYVTTAPPDFEIFKLLLMTVALPYMAHYGKANGHFESTFAPCKIRSLKNSKNLLRSPPLILLLALLSVNEKFSVL